MAALPLPFYFKPTELKTISWEPCNVARAYVLFTPKGLEPSTLGTTIRCGKMLTLVKTKSYNNLKMVLTNQLTKKTQKSKKIYLKTYLMI